MGFDTDCIPDIQSLAGEYFCPLCRLLVYPNEALQSQCTHLYCKACLKYVVSTTRACPYDGYLVTEADSKPLLESNKSLAETIGKIQVHCLYIRSGCTWQGSLSECTSHCSGCAFGNSPVVCNRCGVQIVHRQIHEHAQTCAGVQVQTLNADGSQASTITRAVMPNDNSQTAVQAAVTSTISQASQSKTSSASSQETTLQSNLPTSTAAVAQASMPTSEQWYQQQQQYQQYYRQYPGYDPYLQYQQYNPYQQQAAQQYQQPHAYVQPPNSQTMVPPQLPIQPQAQAQAESHLQSQPQSQLQMQLPVAAQPQNLAQIDLQQQNQPHFQSQLHPAHVYLHPPPQLQPHAEAQPVQLQPPVQMPPHQQSQNAESQIRALAHSQLQSVPQIQSNSQPQAQMHGHHQQPIQQPFSSQPSQPGNPSLQTVISHQSYLQPNSHQPMPLAVPQHPARMYSQAVSQPQSQHTAQTPSQFPQNPPLLRPLQSHGMPPNLQLTGDLPSSSQVQNTLPGQPNPLLAQAHQTGLPVHQRPVAQPVQQPIYQQYVQTQQQFSGPPIGQNHIPQQIAYMQQQMHSQSQLRPQAAPRQILQPQPHQSSPYGVQKQQVQNWAGKPVAPPHGVPDKPPGANLRPMLSLRADSVADRTVEVDASSQDAAKTESGAVSIPAAKAGITIKSESDLKSEGDDNKSIADPKDGLGLLAANNVDLSTRRVKEESVEGDGSKKDVPDADNKQEESSMALENKMAKILPLKEGLSHEELPSKSHDGNLVSQISAFSNGRVASHNQHGPSALLHKPTGPLLLQGTPGKLNPASLGHPTQLRPSGPWQIPPVPQPLNPISDYVQRAGYKESRGPEISIGGFHGPRSASVFSGGQDYYGPPQGPYSQGHGGGLVSYDHEAETNPPQRLNLAMLSNAAGKKGVPGPGFDPSSTVGLQNERFGPTADEHLHPFSQDPARRGAGRGQLEEDLKHFSRPSHFEADAVLKFGGHFSSRTVDRGLHGFRGDMAPRPLENGPYSVTYDSALKMDPVGGHGPSRHFPPYNHEIMLHQREVGEGPIGFRGKPFGRQDPARTDPNFLGPEIGYHRHVDGLGSRSPGRDYLSSRGFGPLHGLDDIDGRESRRFDGSSGRSFHDNRFPGLPSHSRRDEFDGPVSIRVSDNYRFSEFIGHDGMANHLRGENFGVHKLPAHLRFTEQAGFGPTPGNHPTRELPTPGNFCHALFGEPGFRSSFPHQFFPGGDANYPGELDSFDDSRKRKPSSMGWCRICKVDCETVEGLDLHSQTRGHQKMALDMVVTIKQNAKKQKLMLSNNSSLDDASKSRNIVSDGPGDKL